MVNNASMINQFLDLEARVSHLQQQQRGQSASSVESRPDAFQHLFDSIRKQPSTAGKAPAPQITKNSKTKIKQGRKATDAAPAVEHAEPASHPQVDTGDDASDQGTASRITKADSSDDDADTSISPDAASNVTPVQGPRTQEECDGAEDSSTSDDTSTDAKLISPPPTPPDLFSIRAHRGQETVTKTKADPETAVPPESQDTGTTAEDEPQNSPPAKVSKADDKQLHAAHARQQVKALAREQHDKAGPTPSNADLSAKMAEANLQALTGEILEKSNQSTQPDTQAASNSGTSSSTPVLANVTTELPRSTDSAKAELAQTAQESPRPEGAETFDQVVLGLKGKLDPKNGKAEIRLEPPNLGTVKVSLSLTDGQLTAQFQSASDVVRDLLKGNLDKLKSTLQGQGVAVDQLAVSSPNDSGGAGQNSQASFGSATHDGRSAGQFQQEGRQGQQRSGEGFARVFNQAQEAPLDLVA